MTQTVASTCVLGPGLTGLTIGVTVLNLDGTEYAAFSTTGVSETSVAGTYRKAGGVVVPDAGGYLVWGVSGTDYAEATVQVFTGVPQTGDAYARLGAPAGASVSADLAAVKAQTGAIETDTQDLQTQIGTDGAGLTAIGDTRLANLDAAVSSRLATAGYTAPLDAAGIRTAVGMSTNNLDTQLAALPTDADVQTAATAALNAYDPPTKAELDSGLAGLNDPTAAAVADAVWDEAIAGHAGAGSTGEALAAAGSAGDPWATALPGAYGSGTAGKIIGDNINATVSSRASQTSVDDLPTNAELASALASADDATLAAIGALNNLSSAQAQTAAAAALTAYDPPTKAELDSAVAPLATAAALATVDGIVDDILVDTGTTLPGTLATIAGYVDTEVATILAAVDTEVAAIKAKTDNLPASPAAVGSAMTLTAAYDAAKTAATQTSVDDLPTNAELAAAVGPLATYGDVASVLSGVNAQTAIQIGMIQAVVGARGNRAAVASAGTITGGSEQSGTYASTKALDNQLVWQVGGSTTIDFYLEFDVPEGAVLRSVVVRAECNNNQIPTYYISNNASDWTSIGQQSEAVPDDYEVDTLIVPVADAVTAGASGKLYVRLTASYYGPLTVQVSYLAIVVEDAASGGGDATAANQAAILAALADVPTDVDTELTASHGAGVWGAAGSGLLTDTITVNDGMDPLDGVLVQVATDSNFSNIIRSGYTNGLGQVTFHYDAAGTYYGRAEIATFNVLTFEITVS